MKVFRAFKDLFNRFFQLVARVAPGALTVRAVLHKWRGVKLGKEVWIGYDAIIETEYPYLVEIGDYVRIGIRALIVGHFRGSTPVEKGNVTVKIEEEAFIGPGVIILPNVTIGKGAVVTAGSVVSRSVPPMVVVRGNPAKPIARCGISLRKSNTYDEFSRNLKPIR